MTPKRKQRLALVILIVLGIGIATALALSALRQNINLFYTPTQVAQGAAPKGHTFRIGGLVEKGSLKRDKKSLKVNFWITDTKSNVEITYTGILPDLFREGQGVVAIGKMGADGMFHAEQILAKHDEKYMPPEVADALKKQGVKVTSHDDAMQKQPTIPGAKP